MFSWLFIIILSYLFFSLSSFGDKLVLSDLQSPKLYVFYVGILNILAVFLIPFAKFGLPNALSVIWIILEPIIFIAAIYFGFSAVKKFDVSRVVPTLGATQPIFVFFLTWIFFGPPALKETHWLAFLILLLGSFIISVEKSFKIRKEYLKLTLFSSLLFSFDYIFLKLVFLNQPFLQGLIWTKIFVFFFSLFFLLDKNFRKHIFLKKEIINKKTSTLFILTQSFGAVAGILQNFSISLAPVAYLAIINSLRGIQYVFLFIITLIFSFLFPKILKEEISKKIVFQKIISIFLIIIGLTILVLY